MRTKTRLTTAHFAKPGENFSSVSLPHTWNNLDGQDGDGFYWRGAATYILDIPNPAKGMRQYIEFAAANHVATVYCNGRELGTHKGGFSAFRYDLTDAMRPENNTVMVVVSNAKSSVYPQYADFTFYGGLYRDVHFIEVEQAHFDLLKDGSDAVFVTPQCSGKTRVDLFPVNAEGCTVTVSLKDMDGNIVLSDSVNAEVHTSLILYVKNPHLWNGIEDPYLYTCEAQLSKGEEILDSVTVTYGYRSYHIDAENGFHLNGKSCPLRGVARHQDRKDKGWALSREDQEEDMRLIKEMGANTIRLAHYQHDQHFYDLCDREGITLWTEIPFISNYIYGKESYDITLSMMTELIAQNYNHPSVIAWGLANEITMGDQPDALYRNLCDLNALAKKLDPSRSTTIAQTNMLEIESEYNQITDVVSYNHYLGWYSGDVEDNGPWLDRFHQMYPDLPIGLSEYGADNSIKWHSADPENHDYTEEYAAYYHHGLLKTFATRPYLWATHVWNMFDFAADARNEGGEPGLNTKGLVTYDRKIKKDSYYLYQAYWTKKPMIHICGERFVDRAPEERNITVYTNCPEVTLLVNDAEYATRQAVDHAVVFENVALLDGKNTITAYYGDTQANTIILNAVSERNDAYDLPDDEGTAGNWFNDPTEDIPARLTYPKGFYSIRDKIGMLTANPESEKILAEILPEMMKKEWYVDELTQEMIDYYENIQLSSLFRSVGRYFPKGTKQRINEKLTKIKKN